MSEPQEIVTIQEPPSDKADAEKIAELEAALGKRYGEKAVQTDDRKKADSAPADKKEHGIGELRKSRDAALEEIKATKAALHERETKLAEAQQQLADFEGTRKERDTLRGRIEKLEKERDEMKRLESVSALEQSPEFRQKYEEGRKTHVEHLRELATLADIDPQELLDAVGKKGREHVQAMNNILCSAGEFVSGDIVATVKAIQALDADRAKELASASEVMQQRIYEREKIERQRAAERNESRAKAWQDVSGKLSKELGLTAEEVAEGEDVYKNNQDPGKAAEMILRAIHSRRVANLEAEIAKRRAATPGFKAGDVQRTAGKIDFKTERAKLVSEFESARR
jgi:uncharacterized protein YciI